MAQLDQFKTNSLSFGQNGFRVLTGAATATEVFAVIVPNGTATVSATAEEGDNPSSLVISSPLYGEFTNLVVSAGEVIAYLM